MQNYKVFVNQHCIYFSITKIDVHNFDRIIPFDSLNKDELLELVNQLLSNENKKKQLCLSSQNPIESWKIFKTYFKYLIAAGGIVENLKGEILFIHRLGFWDLPKGKLEKGETVEETAKREVEEECGIAPLQIKTKLPSTFHIYKQKKALILKQTNWFYMYYSGNQALTPQAEESIEKAQWFKPSAIPSLYASSYESLKELLDFFLTFLERKGNSNLKNN